MTSDLKNFRLIAQSAAPQTSHAPGLRGKGKGRHENVDHHLSLPRRCPPGRGSYRPGGRTDHHPRPSGREQPLSGRQLPRGSRPVLRPFRPTPRLAACDDQAGGDVTRGARPKSSTRPCPRKKYFMFLSVSRALFI